MRKWYYTIWALIFHCSRKSIFKRCFVDATEDNDANNLPYGPPITWIIFSAGVYLIASNLNFYPEKFRKLNSLLMGLYEFLVISFILEFALACVWTPIDVHIYITLTKQISELFSNLEYNQTANWIASNKYPKAIMCYIMAIGFLTIALYITRTIDFLTNPDFRPKLLSDRLMNGLVQNSSGRYMMNYDDSESDTVNQKKLRNRKKIRKPANSDVITN